MNLTLGLPCWFGCLFGVERLLNGPREGELWGTPAKYKVTARAEKTINALLGPPPSDVRKIHHYANSLPHY